ncbi:MAG: c-type cytochrome [Hyphomicrobium sp.]|nr:c-type cytochrome [Hyphomicrobium sp.]
MFAAIALFRRIVPVFVAACSWMIAASSYAADDELVARGRSLAEEKCARCHALGLDDKSPHEKAPPFRDVVEIYPSEHLGEALAEGIVSGHPDMPVFVLSVPEVEGFLAYLASLAEARGELPAGSARDTAPNVDGE